MKHVIYSTAAVAMAALLGGAAVAQTPAPAGNAPQQLPGVVVITSTGQQAMLPNPDAQQAAPFNPAPLGTSIVTTADKRRVDVVSGYNVTYTIDGRWHPTVAMLTDGLDTRTIFPVEAPQQLWPLEVGKSTTFNIDGSAGVRAITAKVLRTEVVRVPAGSFYSYVIERRDRDMEFRENVATYWYAPAVGSYVKFQETFNRPGRARPAWELVSIVLPHPLAGTVPVNTPGDSPEKRAQFCSEKGTGVPLSDGRQLFLECPTYVQANLLTYREWLAQANR